LRDADIVNFFLDRGIPCTYEEASLIIAQYDENSNGKLSFTEFTQFALSATDESIRQLAASRDYSAYKSGIPVLPLDLEDLLYNLFLAELEFQRCVARIREDLGSRIDFTSKHAFEWIDVNNPIGSINRCEIRQFVEAHIRTPTENELDCIIRR